MQRLLLSMIVALFLALALVGVKRAVGSTATAKSGTTLMAEGGPGQPPIPW